MIDTQKINSILEKMSDLINLIDEFTYDYRNAYFTDELSEKENDGYEKIADLQDYLTDEQTAIEVAFDLLDEYENDDFVDFFDGVELELLTDE